MMQKQINFAQWIQPGSGRPERPSFELACLLAWWLWNGAERRQKAPCRRRKQKFFVMVNLEEEPRPFGLSGDELR